VGSGRHEKKPEKTTGWSSLGLGKKLERSCERIPTQMFFTDDKTLLHDSSDFYKDTK